MLSDWFLLLASDTGESTNQILEKKQTKRGNFKDNAENASIQGLFYIVFPHQTTMGKLFWSIIIFLLMALCLYWCISVYRGWTANPVLTTVTPYSVQNVSVLIWLDFLGRKVVKPTQCDHFCQTKSDNISRMLRITNDFYLVIFS